MSAYVVDRVHIAALVEWAQHGLGGHSSVSWFDRDPSEAPGPCSDGWDAYNAWMSEHYHTLRPGDHVECDRIGQVLTTENVRSVSYRYDRTEADEIEAGELPGSIEEEWRMPYVHAYAGRRLLEPVEVLKALDGYEYQACEHPGWRGSEAQRFTEAVRHWAISKLPGYGEAETWECSEAVLRRPSREELRVKANKVRAARGEAPIGE